jgi:hypothetical protein
MIEPLDMTVCVIECSVMRMKRERGLSIGAEFGIGVRGGGRGCPIGVECEWRVVGLDGWELDAGWSVQIGQECCENELDLGLE